MENGITELHVGVSVQNNFIPSFLDQGWSWEGCSEVHFSVRTHTLELVCLVIDDSEGTKEEVLFEFEDHDTSCRRIQLISCVIGVFSC